MHLTDPPRDRAKSLRLASRAALCLSVDGNPMLYGSGNSLASLPHGLYSNHLEQHLS